MQILYGASQKDVNQQFANRTQIMLLPWHVKMSKEASQPAHVKIYVHTRQPINDYATQGSMLISGQ